MSPPSDPIGITVGEVAKRAGLTVRTLHHYDAIGLVRPSARSASGYRLYNASDIERLHTVQSLKELGLGLDAIGAALAGRGLAPRALVDQQIAAAGRAMEEARALRDSLLLLRDAMARDAASIDDLLDGMRLLAAYRHHLPGKSIGPLLRRWRGARSRWEPLARAVADCRTARAPIDTPQVQRLAQQWMNVAMDVFGGELPTALQWARMHRDAPATAIHAGLDPALLDYLEQAIEARMSALRRHLSDDDLGQLDGSTGPDWERFARDGERLLADHTPPGAPAARALRARYRELLGRTVRHDPQLAAKMQAAYVAEPILSHGHFLSPELRAYLARIPA